jgi:hypothetical protein
MHDAQNSWFKGKGREEISVGDKVLGPWGPLVSRRKKETFALKALAPGRTRGIEPGVEHGGVG